MPHDRKGVFAEKTLQIMGKIIAALIIVLLSVTIAQIFIPAANDGANILLWAWIIGLLVSILLLGSICILAFFGGRKK